MPVFCVVFLGGVRGKSACFVCGMCGGVRGQSACFLCGVCGDVRGQDPFLFGIWCVGY